MSAGSFEPGRGDRRVLAVVDHASNRVPPNVDLGIASELLETHIALDIGATALAHALGYPAFLGAVSRLVVDFNREVVSPELVPLESDGHAMPGNIGKRDERVPLWRDYHDTLADLIAERRPALLLSLHSFTPQLATKPHEHRPWEVGVLYNEDDRAARVALPLLRQAGVVVGDQQPYSGKLLNATMNRHGEANGIPYLGLEVRQDLIRDAQGVGQWAGRLRPVVRACLDAVAGEGEARSR